jgi:hypothetical protein
MGVFLSLAARCQLATKPDRVLDWDIYEALGSPPKPVNGLSYPRNRQTYADEFTASLDAAETLIPTNHKWILYGGGFASVQPWDCTEGDEECDCDDDTRCATPALALCAAALKACAAIAGETGTDGTAKTGPARRVSTRAVGIAPPPPGGLNA